MYFRTYTNSYKALLVCIISFFLTFTPSLVFATTAADGWSISKRLVQGATTFYDGTKNVVLNGKNYAAKGTAAITPTVSQVSKMIVRTGAVLAVDLAIKVLIDGVEYVMDPANNRVKYQAPGEVGDWMVNGIVYPDMTLDQACSAARPSYLHHNGSTCNYGTKDPEVIQASWAYALVSSTTSEERYLPYDAVASQIIGDAAGKEDAKAYVSSVADTALDNDEQRQIVPQSEIVNQLNQSQSISSSGTGTGTAVPTTGTGTGDPTTSPAPYDLKLEFPVFCDWAPIVCQAAQAAIEFPKTAAEWWKSVAEYLKGYNTWLNSFGKDDVTKPDLDEYKIQEPNLDISVHQYFDSSAFCPEDRHIPLSMGGQSLDIIISYSALCTVAQQFRPAVILMSFLAGAFIITNTGRRAETGD